MKSITFEDTALLTEYKLPQEAQSKIIDFIILYGKRTCQTASKFTSPELIRFSFRNVSSYAKNANPKINPYFIAATEKDQSMSTTFKKPSDINSLNTFYNRLHPNLIWNWVDTPVTSIISDYLKPLQFIFKKITRVEAILQLPSKPLQVHNDLLIGNSQQALHKKQNFWGLKVALSEDKLSNGRPILEINKTQYSYFTDSNFFLLNESTQHGALPVKFHRGVINIDGEINLSKLNLLNLKPAQSCKITSEESKEIAYNSPPLVNDELTKNE